MIFLVYAMRTQTLASSIFAVVISVIVCLVLFLLYDIDSDLFAEEKLGFSAFERTFIEIDKMPYIPQESIQNGRFKPKGKIRVGYFQDKKSLKRIIKIEEFK